VRGRRKLLADCGYDASKSGRAKEVLQGFGLTDIAFYTDSTLKARRDPNSVPQRHAGLAIRFSSDLCSGAAAL
jgi:hypothetical protein